MRKLITILLFLSFAVQTCSIALVFIDYYANKAAYEKICINKMRPMMHCNGKCQMMKKLREQEKKQDQQQESNIKLEVLSSASYFELPIHAPEQRIKTSFPTQHIGQVVDQSYRIFHPPAFI